MPAPGDVIATTPTLLCVGALHVDEIARPTHGLQAAASNPVTWSRSIGGVAANVARAAVLDGSTQLLAATGDDDIARRLVETLSDIGLSLHIERVPNSSSGRYSVVLDERGELFIGLADVSLVEQITPTQWLDRLGQIPAAGYLFDANLSEQALAACLSHLRPNPSLRASQGPRTIAVSVSPEKSQRLLASTPNIDLLICNRREAAAMTQQAVESDMTQLSTELGTRGLACHVITDGPDPVLIRDAGRITMLDVPAVHIAAHVNGAGDSLAGATAMRWLQGSNLVAAVRDAGLPAARAVLSGQRRAPALINARS